MTYADDDWLNFVFWFTNEDKVPFPPFNKGDEGAERSECIPRASSTSDTEPFLFFFDREKALLKELRSHPFFFLLPGDPQAGWAELE